MVLSSLYDHKNFFNLKVLNGIEKFDFEHDLDIEKSL